MQDFKSRAKFQFNDVACKVDEREIDGSDQFPLLAGVVQLVQCSSTGPAKPRLLHSLSLARTRRCLGLNVKRLRPQMNIVLCVHWTRAGWRSLRCHLFLSFFICADMTALMPWKFQARENTVRNCSLLKPAEPHPFTRLAHVENWQNGDYSWHIERPAPSTNPADNLTRWPGKTQPLCILSSLILASNVQAQCNAMARMAWNPFFWPAAASGPGQARVVWRHVNLLATNPIALRDCRSLL